MMRKILLTTMLFIAATALSAAKMPKWVKTSRAAVCKITVYDDKGNETGSTTGFFTDSDGFGLSEYNIFSNAARAVTTDGNGVSREILYVSGANRIYDVVRFKVTPDKQLSFLPVAANAAGEGDILYLLPYSSDKSSQPVQLTMAKSSNMAGDYSYYTLSGTMTGDATGAPLFNADGGVVGIVQNPLDTDTCNYAVDSRFANSLSISTALTLNDDNYRGMTFRKALPDNEEQALVWLFMNQGGNQENYDKLLDGFLQQYPDNYVGYLRKGAALMQSNDSTKYAEGIACLDKAVSVADTEDDALFEYASLIYATVTAGKSGYKDWTLDNALEKINQAIGINEQPAYVQLQGNTLYALQRYDEALKAYNKLNKTNLASPDTYYYTSVIKGKLDASADEIIATLDSAVNFYGRPYTSSVAPFILERATIKEGLERYREAVLDLNEYEQIIGSSSLSAEFYYFREQIEVKGRMYEQAMKDIGRAVDISPEDTGLQLEQASLLLRLGMAGDALPIMQALAKDNPEDTDCLRLLGICLMRTGNNSQAAEYLRKAKELGDDLAAQLLEQL